MAPVKRRPRTRSHHKMKLRRRKPNISELVYKFLSLGDKEVRENAPNSCDRKCPVCHRRKRRGEVLDSLNTQDTGGRSMANKRKDSGKNSKLRRVKRRQTPKEQTLSSCVHRCTGGEGMKKMKRYIQKALDFGVESGYLIPKDAAYKVLRVSSDLMNDCNYMNKARSTDRAVSREKESNLRRTPIRFEDYEVQDARRRRRRGRKRRRRSRSGSRRRGRRRRSRRRRRRSEGGEEVVENNNDSEYENKDEKRNNAENNANRDDGNEQMNTSDGAKTTGKREEDGSDLSMDEDETDDEEEKKRDDASKS